MPLFWLAVCWTLPLVHSTLDLLKIHPNNRIIPLLSVLLDTRHILDGCLVWGIPKVGVEDIYFAAKRTKHSQGFIKAPSKYFVAVLSSSRWSPSSHKIELNHDHILPVPLPCSHRLLSCLRKMNQTPSVDKIGQPSLEIRLTP